MNKLTKNVLLMLLSLIGVITTQQSFADKVGVGQFPGTAPFANRHALRIPKAIQPSPRFPGSIRQGDDISFGASSKSPHDEYFWLRAVAQQAR